MSLQETEQKLRDENARGTALAFGNSKWLIAPMPMDSRRKQLIEIIEKIDSEAAKNPNIAYELGEQFCFENLKINYPQLQKDVYFKLRVNLSDFRKMRDIFLGIVELEETSPGNTSEEETGKKNNLEKTSEPKSDNKVDESLPVGSGPYG